MRYLFLKNCSKCMVIYCPAGFGKNKGGKYNLNSICKSCVASRVVAWREINRDKINAKSREWYANHKEEHLRTGQNWRTINRQRANELPRIRRKKNPEKFRKHDRKHDLKRKYNLTPESWDALFDSQGRRCASCKSKTSTGRGWHVDHDHYTGKVCGILCHSCNTGLGHFNDDPEKVFMIYQYALETRGKNGNILKTG